MASVRLDGSCPFHPKRPCPPADMEMPVAKHSLLAYPLQPRPTPSFQNAPYLPNGQPAQAPSGAIPTNATPLLPNNGRVIQSGPVRVLCVADVRGGFWSLLTSQGYLRLSFREPAIAERSCKASQSSAYHPHWRLWFLRRELAGAHCGQVRATSSLAWRILTTHQDPETCSSVLSVACRQR